jgi:hypothetical protein
VIFLEFHLFTATASGRAEENAGRNSDIIDLKRDPVMKSGSSNLQNWLPGLVDVDNN